MCYTKIQTCNRKSVFFIPSLITHTCKSRISTAYPYFIWIYSLWQFNFSTFKTSRSSIWSIFFFCNFFFCLVFSYKFFTCNMRISKSTTLWNFNFITYSFSIFCFFNSHFIIFNIFWWIKWNSIYRIFWSFFTIRYSKNFYFIVCFSSIHISCISCLKGYFCKWTIFFWICFKSLFNSVITF